MSAPTPREQWRQLGFHNLVKILIVGTLFCYLFRNVIDSVFHRWINDKSWSHGFLIPPFSLYFLHQRKKSMLNAVLKPSYIGAVVLLLAILFYTYNTIDPSGYAYFRSMSMLAALGGVVLLLGGWSLVRHTWLAIAFLTFAIPLPERLYRGMTMPMRQWAATVAAALLNLVNGMEARAYGVLIDVIYKGNPVEPALNVAEACSGMRLLTAFLALGVAMAYLHYRPIWQRLILLASTLPIAVLCNIVRVTTTGFIYVLIDPRFTKGVYHDMLGLAMLPLAFALYGCLAWFMSSLFVDETEIKLRPDVVVRKNAR